jgi:hypothetical protein
LTNIGISPRLPDRKITDGRCTIPNVALMSFAGTASWNSKARMRANSKAFILIYGGEKHSISLVKDQMKMDDVLNERKTITYARSRANGESELISPNSRDVVSRFRYGLPSLWPVN